MARKEILFESSDPQSVITILSNALKTSIEDHQSELRVSFPESMGKGYIGGIDFKDGLGMMFFNCQLKEDLVLRYSTTEYQPLRFIFCLEDELVHIIRSDRMEYQLTCHFSSMVSGSGQNEQIFMLPANSKVVYISIEIDRKKYLSKIEHSLPSLPDELREVFRDVHCQRPFLYQGMYSLSIAECINNIKNSIHKGLIRRVFIESKAQEILALRINQYLNDRDPSTNQIIFRKRDFDLIKAARKHIRENLKNPPTIVELARLIGTNENKLKRGFRSLYNLTANQILQHERLDKARLLIAEEKYPVREIAEIVGYKHSGHFSKKFKQRFGMLPKSYLRCLLES